MNTDFIPNSTNTRLIKFKHNLQTNLDFLKKIHEKQLRTSHNFYNKMHVPGKVNFHQLLSIPLQKQIHKENCTKENKTFCLKFQPQYSNRKQIVKNNTLRQNFSSRQINKKQSGVLSRDNIFTSKGQRTRKYSDEQINQQLQQASKTMYFRPVGRFSQTKTQNLKLQRKSLQMVRNKSFLKQPNSSSNHNKQFFSAQQSPSNSSKDKLLMLLQIHKQQRHQNKKSKRKNLSFRMYNQRNNNSKQLKLIKDGNKQLYYESHEYREQRTKSSLSLNDYRKRLMNKGVQWEWSKNGKNKRFKNEMANPSMLSPWQLIQNVEEF